MNKGTNLYATDSINYDSASTSTSVSDEPKTTLISRNVTIMGRRTSIRLEPEMWTALKEISMREKCSVHDICTLVAVRKKENTSLTAAIRVFIMLYFRAATTEDGHIRAGHGDFEFMKRRARIPEQVMSFFSKNKQRANQNRDGERRRFVAAKTYA